MVIPEGSVEIKLVEVNIYIYVNKWAMQKTWLFRVYAWDKILPYYI